MCTHARVHTYAYARAHAYTCVRKEPDVQVVKERVESSGDYIALLWNPECTDLLNEAALFNYSWGAQWASVVMHTFSDSVNDNKDERCHCHDRFKPLCKSGRCVTPQLR